MPHQMEDDLNFSKMEDDLNPRVVVVMDSTQLCGRTNFVMGL
jgi:hypothetical protein